MIVKTDSSVFVSKHFLYSSFSNDIESNISSYTNRQISPTLNISISENESFDIDNFTSFLEEINKLKRQVEVLTKNGWILNDGRGFFKYKSIFFLYRFICMVYILTTGS